jgi:2'-5' RNA ligase
MTTVRTFIAIELPTKARVALADLQSKLKAVVPPKTVRWTTPQNIHLTLHFLGDVDRAKIDAISNTLAATTSDHLSFSLEIGGLGCFPNTRRPRVLWVGLSGDSVALSDLQRHIGQALQTAVNFAPDGRPYAPHLTIGRVKGGIPSRHLKQLSQVIQKAQAEVDRLGTLDVAEVSLVRSELKPTGAVYTQLARGELNQTVSSGC